MEQGGTDSGILEIPETVQQNGVVREPSILRKTEVADRLKGLLINRHGMKTEEFQKVRTPSGRICGSGVPSPVPTSSPGIRYQSERCAAGALGPIPYSEGHRKGIVLERIYFLLKGSGHGEIKIKNYFLLP